ncbi:MAG: hypothetical protein Q8N42_01730 [bacterium]|nr:hypothetical protein [bacterium]
MAGPDVIVVFAFGKFDNPEEEPNSHMAYYAALFAKNWRVPILTQCDIPIEPSPSLEVYFAEEKPEKYLSTLGVAKSFASLAKEKGWRKIFVLAAPPHIRRCARDLRKLGFEVIKYDCFTKTHCRHDGKMIIYNKKSTQWYTRAWYLWWLRETPLRLVPWKKYEKITS